MRFSYKTFGWRVFLLVTLFFSLTNILRVTGNNLQNHSTRILPSQLQDSSIYLPLIFKNYPLITTFGVEAGEGFYWLENAGVSWVRLTKHIRWMDVEAIEGSYDWSKVDQEITPLLNIANQKNLIPIIVVRSAPEWARKYRNSSCGPIKHDKLDSFAKFMGKLVERYSKLPYNVMYYHIWNEPDAPLNPNGENVGCWGEETYPNDPYFGGEYYGEMLKRVYPVMKAANPSIQVLTGALLLDCDPRSWGDGYCSTREKAKQWNFFEGILKSGAGNAFDILAFNGYAYYRDGKNPVWAERYARREWAAKGGQVDGKLDYLRDMMARYGVNKPIILAESAIIDITNEEAKADYLVWTYANTWSQGLKATVWYRLWGWRGSALMGSGNTPLPAYHALKAMIGILAQADYKSREDNPGYTKFIYHLGNQEIWLLIPTGEVAGTNYNVTTPSNFVKLVDIYGNQMPDPGSVITFNRPTYVFRNR